MAKKAAKKNGESLSAHFRELFREKPEWLELDRNGPILDHWKESHGGADMDKRTMQVMSNVKSQERKKLRAPAAADSDPPPAPAGRKPGRKATPAPVAKLDLETLEAMIDHCLSTARALDVENIGDVIHHLRAARNGIVMMFIPR